jgi:hypothetical protein
MSETRYRRLPGTRRGVIARASAWLGPDHILLVQGSRVTETYKRVYFRDVQALLVTKRNRFVLQTQLLLIPPALLIAVLSLPTDWRETGSLLAVLIGVAVLLYLFIVGSFYSCRLYIATAVGNVQVASVFRVWQAQKFHAKLGPLVMASQSPKPSQPPNQ